MIKRAIVSAEAFPSSHPLSAVSLLNFRRVLIPVVVVVSLGIVVIFLGVSPLVTITFSSFAVRLALTGQAALRSDC